MTHKAAIQTSWRRVLSFGTRQLALLAHLQELDAAASTAAHRIWPDAVDDALRVAEAISRERPRDPGELLIQFEATWWWLIEDDSVLDGAARRWLRRFRRSLRQLAAKT